jgi:predicted nucleic acid-binding protein
MKYVLDASVGVKWALVEHDTPKARTLRDEYQQVVHELLAPDVFPVEVAHALSRAERQKRITPAEGAQLLRDVLMAAPRLHSYLPLLSRAYAISSPARIGVYGCLYVALAERRGCELITADDKLVKNLQPQFPFITALAVLA